MRPLAIELAFDLASNQRLLRVWSRLIALYGGPTNDELGVRPHVTLALFRGTEPGDLSGTAEALACQLTCFSLDLATVDHFHTSEGAVFLRPEPSADLARVHQILQDVLGVDRDLVDAYYRPAAWKPHCTMAISVPKALIATVISACRSADALGKVRVERLQVVRYYPATEIWGASLDERKAI